MKNKLEEIFSYSMNGLLRLLEYSLHQILQSKDGMLSFVVHNKIFTAANNLIEFHSLVYEQQES